MLGGAAAAAVRPARTGLGPAAPLAAAALATGGCPNVDCGAVIALALELEAAPGSGGGAAAAVKQHKLQPRHVSCPECSEGLCGSCGAPWTLDGAGASHTGVSCERQQQQVSWRRGVRFDAAAFQREKGDGAFVSNCGPG